METEKLTIKTIIEKAYFALQEDWKALDKWRGMSYKERQKMDEEFKKKVMRCRRYIRFQESTREKFFKSKDVNFIRQIKVDHNFNDFFDIYNIYEIDDYFITHIIEEWYALGSPEVDLIHDVFIIEKKQWIIKEITLHHWEDGTHKYLHIPINRNTANYLLELKPPEDFHKWIENEYQDYDCFMPDDEEFIKEI